MTTNVDSVKHSKLLPLCTGVPRRRLLRNLSPTCAHRNRGPQRSSDLPGAWCATLAAIAFGIGGREVAREILENARQRGEEVRGEPSIERGDDQGSVDERPDAHQVRRDD
jgi:hypothetical protein